MFQTEDGYEIILGLYRVAQIPMTLSYLEGHYSCLKCF